MKDGKKEYAIEPVEVEGILRALQKTTLPILEQQGFAVDIQRPEEPLSVLGDFQGILRCVQNLLDNAAKYSGDNRWIGIRVTATYAANGPSEIAIGVADHGIGVEPEVLEHICEPFYRGPRAVAAQIRGSGLGLSVVRHIVDAIGGRLSVASEEGQGSIFTLHLRAVEQTGPENQSETTEETAAV
jgi:signal transduction histidine kinase